MKSFPLCTYKKKYDTKSLEVLDFFSNFAAESNINSTLLKIMVKKYFIGSFAALLTVGFMTSCSHDDVYDASQDMDVLKYEAAFKAKFGEPAPDQDWGFGINASKTRGTRAIASIFNFPSDCDASKFLADVPTGVQTYEQVGQNGYATGVSYIENRSSEVNIWGQYDGSKTTGGTLYIKGNCDFSSVKFYVASNTEIYLVEGATLTLAGGGNGAGNLQAGCNFYIAEGAKIVTDGELVLNNGLHIYNHGTIEAAKLSVNNNSILYNVGTVTVSGELSTENGNSVIVNDGDITATRLHTAGSSHVQNNADFNISGNTDIDSNNNTWVNNGQYTTRNFYYTAGSCDVINNCRLTVTNLFKINLGDTDKNGFQMDSNCGVVTKDFEAAGPCFIYMGSNSVFKVTGTATMNITKDVYGIYGPESGNYAVFQAKDIVNGAEDPNQGFVANYFQKVYVVAETHFAQGYSDKSAAQQAAGEIGSQPYYRVADGAGLYVNGEKPSITIAESTCNPGFGGGDPDEFVPVIRVMAEDLSAKEGSDFDFNDVVFDVMWIDGGAKIRLMAAGGTLPLTIEGQEVHELFKEKTQAMINTIENDRSHEPVIFTITGDFKTDGVNDANKISVKVYKNDQWKELTAVKGKVASKIGVDPKVDWQKEWNDIEDLYPDFGAWVRGEVDLFY